jgi:hypothetical protein
MMANSRIKREEQTLRIMISLYCRKKHGSKKHLCEDCAQTLDFSLQRLHYCPYGENKPTCANCDIHCYTPDMREKIKEIMRFAGPRMLWRHPVLAIQHLRDERKKFE